MCQHDIGDNDDVDTNVDVDADDAPDGPELALEQVDEAMSWQDKGEQVRRKPHLLMTMMIVECW